MKKFLTAIGTKNIIIISGILLIGVAIYINLSFTPPNSIDVDDISNLQNSSSNLDYDKALGQASLVNNQTDDVYEDNYFAMVQIDRARARDESMETLQTVIDSADSLPDVRDTALRDMNAIALDIEKESNIETLIRAKGYECIAVVNGDLASIVIRSNGLMPNEVAQIKEIVYEQANILPVNVKILERE